MDYEKAYKAMMQRARELHKDGNALTKQQMEIVCPELADSEDDVYIINILECIIGKHRPDEIFKIGNKHGVSAYKISSWLKSIRPQPKQEWNEDDKARIEWCIADIERAKFHLSQTNPKLCDIEIN